MDDQLLKNSTTNVHLSSVLLPREDIPTRSHEDEFVVDTQRPLVEAGTTSQRYHHHRANAARNTKTNVNGGTIGEHPSAADRG